MRFNPLLVSSLIVDPLRYFFSNYTSGQNLVWSANDKISTIEIGTVNDFNTIILQQKPRVLVNRGNYQVNKTSLTDNMMESPGVKESLGAMKRRNLVFINGAAEITIESRNEGTCELVTDMVTHFLVWSRPFICSSQGFKEFALPLGVSDCHVSQEDTEKFQTVISVPYMMEEDWSISQDAIKLKGFFTTFNPSYDQTVKTTDS